MSRVVVLSGVLLWSGMTLLLAEIRWFARRPLVERLRPFAASSAVRHRRRTVLSGETFREVIGPISESIGDQFARVLGVREGLALRLERLHSPLDVAEFRTRQLGWSLAAFGIAGLASAALRPPAVVALLLMVAAPALAFAALEQQVTAAATRRQRRLFHELPVVAEQLAMLLAAGYSLGAALNRAGARGKGVCAADINRVCARIGQGLSEAEALAEWARTAQVDALDRLVAILALNRETGDLGRLLSQEARAVRRDVHRQLMEVADRRTQQVWIPVTVAALVPGALFLAIPFIEALRLFAQ